MTASLTSNHAIEHEDVLQLLPFYVTGKLGEAEQDAVGQHVRTCLACRRQLNQERLTHEAFRTLDPVPTPAQHAFERMLTRLDANTPPPVTSPSPKLVSPHRLRGAWRAVWIPSAIAASLAAVMVGTVLMRSGGLPDSGRYRTLSDAVAVGTEAGDFAVVFKDTLPSGGVEEALRALELEVIRGPGTAGAYTVRLAPGAKGDRDTVLVKLQARADVVLAYRIEQGGRPQ